MASLLEVGTGFHAELTGRENIQLNGAILGMTRAEIKSKFDEIVEFSEIGRFLDTPVKRYSSGMYVRLAFAVAAHLEPEILIVDEVLAVGDAELPEEVPRQDGRRRQGGRTVLFVSHNMAAVAGAVQHCIHLEGGRVVGHGSVESVVTITSQPQQPPTRTRSVYWPEAGIALWSCRRYGGQIRRATCLQACSVEEMSCLRSFRSFGRDAFHFSDIGDQRCLWEEDRRAWHMDMWFYHSPATRTAVLCLSGRQTASLSWNILVGRQGSRRRGPTN